MKTMITMKIRITESQYNILVNKPRDVVFGRVNETSKSKESPEEIDVKIEEILDYVRSGGEFKSNDENYIWLHKRLPTDKTGKFKNAWNQIKQIQIETDNRKANQILDNVRNGGEFKWNSKLYKWLYNKKQNDKTGNFINVWNHIKQIQEELENKKIEEILDYVRSGGKFDRNYEHYGWLSNRTIVDETGKFKNTIDLIIKIQEELENKKIEEILDYVRSGGEFKRNSSTNETYKWLLNKLYKTKKEKFDYVSNQINKIQGELENKKIEDIINYVKNGGEFIREATKDENYRWLRSRFYPNKREKFDYVLNKIEKIQIELGNKREWWGERKIKNFLEEMGFTDMPKIGHYKIDNCKNSLTCTQYKFDVYLPYNENNIKINKNIPETGIIFEYDGIQHFRFIPYFHKTEEKFNSQILRDKEKNLYCRKNNIKLVRIPYTSKTEEDIKQDINLALDNPSTFILTGDYPKVK